MVDLSQLNPGRTGSAELLVGVEHSAPSIGSGLVPVLGTPVMINLIEAAALAAVERLLPPGHQSLGIHLDVRHFAATPIGMRVRATAELRLKAAHCRSGWKRATTWNRSATARISVWSSTLRASINACSESLRLCARVTESREQLLIVAMGTRLGRVSLD